MAGPVYCTHRGRCLDARARGERRLRMTHGQADNLVKARYGPQYAAVLLGGIRGTPVKRCLIRIYDNGTQKDVKRNWRGFTDLACAATWEEALRLVEQQKSTGSLDGLSGSAYD